MQFLNARELDQSLFEAALELQQRLDRARDPGVPVTPAGELRATFDDDASDNAHHERLVAFDDEEAVAFGHLELTRDSANKTLAIVEITPVYGDASKAVLSELLRMARGDGRTSVIAFGDCTPETDAFWTGLGAELRFTEQESDLDLASVDAELMTRWIDAASDDIDLVHWAGHCPDEHIDALVVTANAMNDAPTDDLEIEDMTVDAATLRTDFEARDACGIDYLGILAIGADGSAAGATEVFVNRFRPAFAWQWNTVVLPAYRGRGIGRWMKAAMWQRLRTEVPEVATLRTGNAESNAAMLAINAEMGFRPSHLMGCWQADLATLESGISGVGSEGRTDA
ncbi:MAG: GNAT family N-acetyltransferase [Acidimicrobiia bacterium]|nr:GNAT family N-acetyltransferase [Acidimicrobiia bacterium]MYG57297.1 GNAT family N-acetyltransferase [Acidimicrobiia bacterium]MYJ31944.1 GNAT family N-acetyltransferase [Acidimicrobiia bacterium]